MTTWNDPTPPMGTPIIGESEHTAATYAERDAADVAAYWEGFRARRRSSANVMGLFIAVLFGVISLMISGPSIAWVVLTGLFYGFGWAGERLLYSEGGLIGNMHEAAHRQQRGW